MAQRRSARLTRWFWSQTGKIPGALRPDGVYRDTTEAVRWPLARLPVYVATTRDNSLYRHRFLFASSIRAFFPSLGDLVIFGTMLGSVADRQKEIYLQRPGLAPRHVATLFFAESMVYRSLAGWLPARPRQHESAGHSQ